MLLVTCTGTKCHKLKQKLKESVGFQLGQTVFQVNRGWGSRGGWVLSSPQYLPQTQDQIDRSLETFIVGQVNHTLSNRTTQLYVI